VLEFRDIGVPAHSGQAYIPLTDLDPEFTEAVDPTQLVQVRRALLTRSVRLSPGAASLPSLDLPPTTFALLLLQGSMLHRTRTDGAQLITFVSAGDVLMPFTPEPGVLSGAVTLTVTERVLMAALDQRFLRAAAVWPQLMQVVQQRMGDQLHRLALHGAILQLPRVDQRLLALLRLLADRSGRVTRDGIVVRRTLNHQTLADLVGARRPTVSLALKTLQNEGRLQRRGDGDWLLPHAERRPGPAGPFPVDQAGAPTSTVPRNTIPR
jgi:CRP/FNR family cyclic AMP-dependent transcriptional regulator